MAPEALQIRVLEDEAGDETRSLVAWLREDYDVSTISAAVRPSEMSGGVLEAIEVLIQPDGVVVALVAAVTTWLSNRQRRSRMSITRDGRTIEFDVPLGADAQEIAKSVADELN